MRTLATFPTGLGTSVRVDVDPEAALAVGRLVDTATGLPALNTTGRQLEVADAVLFESFLEPVADQNLAGARVYGPAAGWTARGWVETFASVLEDGVPVAA